jgi:gas vesicle protein
MRAKSISFCLAGAKRAATSNRSREKESEMTRRSGESFFKGFVIGGALGALAAFLMAPQPGEETRTQIREKGLELKEQAETAYADLQDRIETAAADLRTRVDELSAKVDQVVVRTRADVAQKTAELAEQVAPEEAPVEEPMDK